MRIVLIAALFFMISCEHDQEKSVSDKNNQDEKNMQVSSLESLEMWFLNKRNGENEYERLKYINSVYSSYESYDSFDTLNLYDLYIDSIGMVINDLVKENIDGLKYNKDSLLLGAKCFIDYCNTMYNSEIDPNQGVDYHQYKKDKITYELIGFYFKLKNREY